MTNAIGPSNKNAAPNPSPSPGQFKPGYTLIHRFVVVRLIAQGGMGAVYEVEDLFLHGVHIALKIVLPDIAGDPALEHRFEREVLLAQEVTHENLCPIYAIFRSDEPPYFSFLTMKLLPGVTLAARLQETIPVSAGEALAILRQLVLGLAAVHAAGIVHGDIKPNNIMLDGRGPDVHLWITDFGLARLRESDTTIPGKGAFAGTPGYLAPELYVGRPHSQSTDIFALGVVLHEIFTGEKPTLKEDYTSVAVSRKLNSSTVPSTCAHLIEECLSRDPERRCEAFGQALALLDPKNSPTRFTHSATGSWSRRRFAGTGIAAVCALGAGMWWKRDQVENLLHPLPQKRFVALLNWPVTSDAQFTPLLAGVLSAIQSELSRLEAFDRDLFVISPDDVGQNLTDMHHLKQVCDPLGANLVLAASNSRGTTHPQLHLRLLDPLSDQSLREKTLDWDPAQTTALPQRAVHAAASLLNINSYLQASKRTDPGTHSTAAYTAFQSAEALMKQPNDSGLDAAIEKYKQAAELDVRYAMAHAKLAQAYARLYTIRRQPAALDLARRNSLLALSLNPDLVDGHLALAGVFEYSGDEQGALTEFSKALALDPSNPKTLIWAAQLYVRLNRWEDAERSYRRVLKERPNYWLAYNDLGFALHEQGKYQDAIAAFRSASMAAPGSSLALSNLGSEYLETGDFDAAIESLEKSLALNPASDGAAANMALALRAKGRSEDSLSYALKAVQLNPAEDINWLELGESYTSLRTRPKEAKAAYLRATKEAERHLETDPDDGPGWMLLALYEVKSGATQNALSYVAKAESMGARDRDSQLNKARILEALGKRDEALATLVHCSKNGPIDLQVESYQDMRSLRKDPRYREIVGPSVVKK